MSRPVKPRYVTQTPEATYFKPRGIPMSFLEEVVLTIDECEALRLADLEGLSQEEAAVKMKISRATFGRVVEKARRTVVDAIVNGKAILIEGGCVKIGNTLAFQCKNCSRHWQFQPAKENIKKCPHCKHAGWSR
jgi:uncharacterized protein